MFLREFLTRTLLEGGNLELTNPQDPTSPYKADEIDLKVHQRNYIVPILDKLLHDINNTFKAQYKIPIWSDQLLASKQFLGGSSLHFFDTKGITDQQFVAKKPKVGDIDTQCNKELEDELKAFLTANYHKKIGDATLLGYSAGNEQFNALFQFDNPPVKIQIDFEFGRYSPETNTPDEWFRFSHSSDWKDIEAGVKGVFHKYLYRALSGATSKQAYVAKMTGRGKARSMQISDEPEIINTASFAVASKQGGGVSQKYVPYIDPTTNKPITKNGLPVMQEVPSTERDYEQSLSKQFFTFFGHNPEPEDSKLQWSFVGTLDLINKYIDKARKPRIVEDFLDICFEPGSQMITRDDPQRDAQIKFTAIDLMLEKLGLQAMRPKAVQMAKAYEDEFNEVEAYKKEHPEERQPRAALKKLKAAQGLTEAEENEQPAVKAQLRKGMPHLRDLKPADFLDLLDEIHDGNGQFKLENIPLNVKIDGFGGRFGKNSDGRPFMATSRTEPRYEPGFLKYHQQKGTQDPEILGRAKLFDTLFEEMMKAIQLVDSKLGSDFLVDKQVTCEVLFLPFATPTEDGRLKFVGIDYDQLPQGVQLALVPFRVVTASTGEELPNEQQIVKQLTRLGQQGSIMFIDNQLVQKEGLDVTEIINPLDNIEELKSIVSGTAGKRDRASLALRKQVEEKLKPVQIALEKAIDEDPNIIGKDMLGQDYEGIVINSRLGPIKVTSQRQKDIIAQKNAAKSAARAEQPRSNSSKTAVVAIGSFAGHKGHQELWNYTVKKAQELKGEPYLFIGNAEGKDDPIPPAVKVETWHRLYPEYADNISTVMAGGSLMQKIKHELINPLPGKAPRYDNIIIMVGEDRADMPIANALMKAVNKFQGYEHVKVSLQVTPRGTGMSFTKLRNVLKDPNATPEHQLQVWEQGFDVQRLGVDWIKHLMDITRKGMGIQAPAQRSPVAEMRLFNSLIRPIKENAIAHVAKDLENPSGREAQKYANFDAAREKRRARQERDALAARNSRQYSSSRDAANKVKDGVTIREKEGSPEGVPHLTKELLTHIVQQVGTEGAHAICKSIKWGDGAAAELLTLITNNLKQDIANMKECAGSGVIASKKQAKDPRYSMSLTKDVRPGQIAKNLKAFSLEEDADPCWDNYKQLGTKKKGGKTVPNCVPKEGMEEGEADYGADYQDKVKRLGQMAKQGERKTVWDPVKRVYKTVPVNPPKEQGVAEGSEKTIWVKPSSNHTLIVVKSSSPDIEAGEEYDEGDLNNYANNFGYKIKEQGVAEGILNKIANKVMGAAPEQPKYKVGQRVKYETSPHQPDWEDGGSGVGVITDYKNGHYMINGNPVNHFEIKGVVGQGVAEGSNEAEKYKTHLLKTAPRIMDFLAKTVKGWRPSDQEMLGAIDTAYMVMQRTGDVKQAGKAMMDELNTLHKMSQGQHGVNEKMMPASMFAGSKKNKLGPAGQLKGNMKRPAKAGDLVGGSAEESFDGGSYAAKKPGYSGEANYTAHPNWRGMNIGEDVETAMASAIARLIESQLK